MVNVVCRTGHSLTLERPSCNNKVEGSNKFQLRATSLIESLSSFQATASFCSSFDRRHYYLPIASCCFCCHQRDHHAHVPSILPRISKPTLLKDEKTKGTMASTSSSPPATSTPASTVSDTSASAPAEEHQSDGSKLKTFISILRKSVLPSLHFPRPREIPKPFGNPASPSPITGLAPDAERRVALEVPALSISRWSSRVASHRRTSIANHKTFASAKHF